VNGTMFMDKFARGCPQLEHFVCFSSVVAGRGNGGQTNYGFANSVMERTCEVRKKDGLPGLAIQWGAIGDVGVVAESMGGNEVVIGGTLPQRIPSCMDVLDQFLSGGHTVCSSIVKADSRKAIGSGKGDLVRTVCHILGVKDPSTLDPNTSLGDLGLDSLMAVEVRQGLERDYDVVLSTQEVRLLKIKELQVIGSKTFKPKTNAVRGSEANAEDLGFTFDLPTDIFIKLKADCELSGRPIFFVPPIEGDFRIMAPLSKHIDRPIIGINWTADADKCEDSSQLAKFYIQKLRETYPDGQYDLVGYSFGGLIAYEMAIQLQAAYGEKAAKKLLLLDSSPTYMKSFTSGLESKNKIADEAEGHVEMLISFTSILCPLDKASQSAFKDNLLKLATMEDRTKAVADFVSKESGQAVEGHMLTEAAERYFKKVKMVHLYEASHKFSGDIKLVRATETGYSTALLVDIDADYGLVQNCSGQVESIVLNGDHKTFIPNHLEEIGTIIDSHFQYFAFA